MKYIPLVLIAAFMVCWRLNQSCEEQPISSPIVPTPKPQLVQNRNITDPMASEPGVIKKLDEVKLYIESTTFKSVNSRSSSFVNMKFKRWWLTELLLGRWSSGQPMHWRNFLRTLLMLEAHRYFKQRPSHFQSRELQVIVLRCVLGKCHRSGRRSQAASDPGQWHWD